MGSTVTAVRPPRRQRPHVVAALVVAALGIAACSDDDASAPDEPLVTTTSTAPPATIEPQEFEPGEAAFSRVPDPIPVGEHGDLLRYQPVPGAPEGADWFRIMYLSETITGEPTVVTGIITVPTGEPPGDGWRLATHAHGSTGLADDCAPSHTVAGGTDQVSAAELTLVANNAIEHGYVVVSTDYEGQGGPGRHPFLVGESEGRSVMDAARAARQFPGLDLPGDVGIVGYSQGGHAALWANQVAPRWTPELTVVGTLAGAPASEMAELLAVGGDAVLDSAGSVMLVGGLAASDPDLEDDLDSILTAEGRRVLDQLDRSCSVAAGFVVEGAVLSADPRQVEPWAGLLRENTPGFEVTDSPILVVQGREDVQVPFGFSEALLARLCEGGQVVERRIVEKGGHVVVAVPSYSDGFDWLVGLDDGDEPVSSCG